MQIRPFLALNIALVLMLGCSMTPPGAENDGDEVVGEPIEELFSRWGQPHHTSQLPNSDRILHVWEDDGCKTHITTDADGVVQGYALTGDCSFVGE